MGDNFIAINFKFKFNFFSNLLFNFLHKEILLTKNYLLKM